MGTVPVYFDVSAGAVSSGLRFGHYRLDVARGVKNADDFYTALDETVHNQDFLEILNRPDPDSLQGGVIEMPGCAHFAHGVRAWARMGSSLVSCIP